MATRDRSHRQSAAVRPKIPTRAGMDQTGRTAVPGAAVGGSGRASLGGTGAGGFCGPRDRESVGGRLPGWSGSTSVPVAGPEGTTVVIVGPSGASPGPSVVGSGLTPGGPVGEHPGPQDHETHQGGRCGADDHCHQLRQHRAGCHRRGGAQGQTGQRQAGAEDGGAPDDLVAPPQRPTPAEREPGVAAPLATVQAARTAVLAA